MDIHRCRFVPYRPQSINALAFSHRSNPKQRSPKDLRLALGRENGDVEIWNPASGQWMQEKILRGSRDRTIEQLAWTQDLIVNDENPSDPFEDGLLRLFTSGGSQSITEWDLVTGQQKRHAEGNSGDIWCFAAQPQWKRSGKEQEMSKIAEAPSQMLAAGCSDGRVILFTTADDDLQFLRILSPAPKKKSKVISIAWRDRATVVVGYEDSLIRVIDVPTRTVIRAMSLGKPVEGNSSVVWTVKCLPDGTILSGDSSGELKIWDAKTLSLSQRLKAHDADILDIATNTTGDIIFTAGVDRKMAVYKQLSLPSANKRKVWQKLSHRRFHQHDVKALAAFEGKDISILISGGMDTVPIVMPLRNWESEYHRSLSHLPQKPQMSCSSRERLMLTWWDREMLIWNLPEAYGIDIPDETTINHQLLAKIELKGDEYITAAQISQDGRMVVAATAAGVKLFQIRKRVVADEIEIRTRPIDLPIGIRSFGSSLVGFSPNSKWLFSVRTSGIVAMAKITTIVSDKDKPQIHQQVTKLGRKVRRGDVPRSNKLGTYMQTINCCAFSSDSRALAIGDISGAIEVWLLKGHELQEDLDDSLVAVRSHASSDSNSESGSDSDSDDESDSRTIHGQKWIRNPSGASLPRLESAILALSFKPQPSTSSSEGSPLGLHPTRHNPQPVSHELPALDTKLIAVTAAHEIVEFEVMSSKLSEWSRRNPRSCHPESFTQIKDRAMGVFWDCDSSTNNERLWLYGHSWLFMLDMTRDLALTSTHRKIGQIGKYDVREPAPTSALAKRGAEESKTLSQKKRRKRNTGAGDEKKTSEYNPSLDLDAMDIDTGLLSPASDDEDKFEDDMEMENASTLTRLRRKTTNPSLTQDEGNLSDSAVSVDSPTLESAIQQRPPPHHTIFRYRAIFGITPIHHQQQPPFDSGFQAQAQAQAQNQDSEDPSSKASPPNLEIILVERPLYDVDLLPRFDGGQDWGT